MARPGDHIETRILIAYFGCCRKLHWIVQYFSHILFNKITNMVDQLHRSIFLILLHMRWYQKYTAMQLIYHTNYFIKYSVWKILYNSNFRFDKISKISGFSNKSFRRYWYTMFCHIVLYRYWYKLFCLINCFQGAWDRSMMSSAEVCALLKYFLTEGRSLFIPHNYKVVVTEYKYAVLLIW